MIMRFASTFARFILDLPNRFYGVGVRVRVGVDVGVLEGVKVGVLVSVFVGVAVAPVIARTSSLLL